MCVGLSAGPPEWGRAGPHSPTRLRPGRGEARGRKEGRLGRLGHLGRQVFSEQKPRKLGESSRRLLHPVRPQTLTDSCVTTGWRPCLGPHTSSNPSLGRTP